MSVRIQNEIFYWNFFQAISAQLLWNSPIEFHVPLLLKWTYYVHAHNPQKFLFDFFLFKNIELWPKYAVLCNKCETDLACVHEFEWQKSCLDVFEQWTLKCLTDVTIINWLCVYNYYQFSIMIFCPIASSLMQSNAIPFLQHCQASQCWSVGYVSLLTLSFISVSFVIPCRLFIFNQLSLIFLNIKFLNQSWKSDFMMVKVIDQTQWWAKVIR